MPRARNIKPGTFENEELSELPIPARYLFIALWTLADKDGRLEDRPKRIRKYALTYDDVDVDELLQMLHDAGFIYRYGESTRQAQCKNQRQYIQILKFTEHQTPHCKEKASTIPAPDKHSASTVPAPPDCLNPDSLNPDTGRKPFVTSDDVTEDFESLWQTRPKRKGQDNKQSALKAYLARIREGHTHEEMLDGIKAYRRYLESEGKIGTEFVKLTATFLGPNKHFLDIPDTGSKWDDVLAEAHRQFRGCQ